MLPLSVQGLEVISQAELVIRALSQAEWHSCIVAVKMLKRSDEIAMNDFRTELDVLQKVGHEHILAVGS